MPNHQPTVASTIRTKMLWYVVKYLLAGLLLGAVLDAPAQNTGDPGPAVTHVAGKLCKKVQEEMERVSRDLLRKNIRYLEKMEADEENIKRKLVKQGIHTDALFDQAAGRYASLRKELASGEQTVSRFHTNYTARLDTLQAGLAFLTGSVGSQSPQMAEKIQHALGSIRELQHGFKQTEDIQRFVEQRSRFLQQQLTKYGLVKEVKKLQKQAYYYRAQVQQYKALLNDPSKLEAEAFRLLSNLSPFREFFQSHSWLAGMFSLPGQDGKPDLVSAAGLQSRDLVAQSLAQRFGTPVQVQQLVQQQGKEAPSGFDPLKNIPKSGGNENIQLPQFQPNTQKTRRLKDRLELGSNLQTIKANRFFPSTSVFGLSVGYKLNDKSIVGVGSVYRMGWGRSIRHISITHEGIGMRSFIDYKLKGNFWLSGGAELNYQSRFRNFEILNNYSAWQQSALLGLSKKYKVSNKLKGNMQLLYDFLWKQQIPRTQALVFRVGYNFK